VKVMVARRTEQRAASRAAHQAAELELRR